MEPIPPPRSSLPPPMPVTPLNYQSPIPAEYRPQNSQPFSEKAARFSWRATIVAIVLGICSGVIRGDNAYMGIVVGVINLLLIIGGLLAGIIGLCGIRLYGAKRLLIPSLVGTCLNGILVFCLLSFLLLARSSALKVGAGRASGAASPPSLTLAQAKQQGADAVLKYPGWVGASRTDAAALSAVSVPGESPFAQDILSKFPNPFQMIVVTLQANQNPGPFTIDLRKATVTSDDGRTRQALDTHTVLQSSPDADVRSHGMATFPELVTVPRGTTTLSTAIALFPADIDLHAISSITFQVNGREFKIEGRFLSVEEKQDNVRRSKAAQN